MSAHLSMAYLRPPFVASWLEHTQAFCASLGPARVAPMGKHMDAKTRALCYFYRHPPRNSGVKPVPYRKIPRLLPVRPRPTRQQVWTAVRTFHSDQKSRGRKKGFRKTTPAEDRCILRAFYKVRQPLESLVESRDVWNELTPAVRSKVCLRTVRNRLRDKGYAMEEKRAGDDMGEQWRRKRVLFSLKRDTLTTDRRDF